MDENNSDQSLGFTDGQHFHRLSTISIPVVDSPITSPIIPQNETQSSFKTQSFNDEFNSPKKIEMNHFSIFLLLSFLYK